MGALKYFRSSNGGGAPPIDDRVSPELLERTALYIKEAYARMKRGNTSGPALGVPGQFKGRATLQSDRGDETQQFFMYQ